MLHLGGLTASIKTMSVCPFGSTWRLILGIKSLLDLGCGKGTLMSCFVIRRLEYVIYAEEPQRHHKLSFAQDKACSQ
jgi:hypothetical protein